MTERPPVAEFVASVFGPVSTAPVFVCSLPNDRGDPSQPGEKRLMSRDLDQIARFVEKWDRPGRGLFFSVGTIRADAQPEKPGGSPRARSNVAEIICLHGDVDLKDIEIDRAELLRRLLSLPCPPSIIVWSGRGAHPYWLLTEGLEATPAVVERIEAANRQIQDLIAGDSVHDVCRLMRLPGSHNTKDGAFRPVEIVHARYNPRYELDELEEMLATLSPIIRRRAAEEPAGDPTNPFVALAKQLGFKPPVDVEKRLEAMAYQGTGGNSIHETQLAVSAALLNHGTAIDEVVDTVMLATKAAAGIYGERWNWPREERAVRRMCEDWQRKHPPPARTEVVNGGAVVDFGRAKAEREKKAPRATKAGKGPSIQVVVADGVVSTIREDGGDILLTEGAVWLYRDGLWAVMTPAEEQWLRTLVQQGCDALGHAGDTKAATAAWKRLTEHPDLFRRTVDWDRADVIATSNGMLALRTREFTPHSPSFYARRKIGVEYRVGADCPKFRRFLAQCFVDRPVDDAAAIVDMLQEFFGAMLAIRTLAREQRKALFLNGPSRTGKTQLATIARRLIGEPVASPSVVDVGKDFGLQSLSTARAWIRDDAINEADVLDPARFKVIITGEPLEANRKFLVGVTMGFEIPVILTTNAMPRARDSSDAIYNRCLVVDMLNVVDEGQAEMARAALDLPVTSVLADAIVEEEGPGILNWALVGLDRLRARGRFDPPASVAAAVQRFKDTNNPIAEWARIALRRSPTSKVEKSDLLCCLHGWQHEEHGDEAKATGGRALYHRLVTIMPGIDTTLKTEGTRYVGGLLLTDEGLSFWDRHHSGGQLKGGSMGSSSDKGFVNKAWSAPGMRQDDPNATRF